MMTSSSLFCFSDGFNTTVIHLGHVVSCTRMPPLRGPENLAEVVVRMVNGTEHKVPGEQAKAFLDAWDAWSGAKP